MKSPRFITQLLFLTITLVAVFIVKGNAECWCPFGGIEAIYTYYSEGNLPCSLGISNFYILGAILVCAILLKRAFCSFACPIGAISEWIQRASKMAGIKPLSIAPAADKLLSTLKYLLLALVLYITWTAGELLFRGFDPCYALISRHGEDITIWSYIILGALVLASIFIHLPFCRWFCPLAAVLNPFSFISPSKIKRNHDTCTSCRKCAKACPMAIPVDKVDIVNHARCTLCLECIETCPEKEKQALTFLPGMFRISNRAAVAATVLLLIGTAAVAAGLFPLPSFTWNKEAAKPDNTAQIIMEVEGLECRGSANLFVYFLDRDDELEIPGYVRLEAWPSPGGGEVKIIYDPTQANEDLIKMAITETYYDALGNQWRASPFIIKGYDPFSGLLDR